MSDLGYLYIIVGFCLLVFRTRARAEQGMPLDPVHELFLQVLTWPLFWAWCCISVLYDGWKERRGARR